MNEFILINYRRIVNNIQYYRSKKDWKMVSLLKAERNKLDALILG